VLGWVPTTPLRSGMEKTYAWVYEQVKERAERLAIDAAA